MVTSGDDHVACICCIHVFSRERPILVIWKDDGHPAEFMCGFEDHNGPQDGRVIGFGHLREWDSTIPALGEIENGCEYERPDRSFAWRKVTTKPPITPS